MNIFGAKTPGKRRLKIFSFSTRGLLGCDGLYCCGRIPTFQGSMLHPSSLHPEDGGSMDQWNFSILPQHYMMSQLRRPWLEEINMKANHVLSWKSCLQRTCYWVFIKRKCSSGSIKQLYKTLFVRQVVTYTLIPTELES